MGTFIGKSKKTKSLLEVIVAAFRTGKIPYLQGAPGTGKSALIESISMKLIGVKPILVIGSTMDPVDMAGLPMAVVAESGRTITENVCPWWLDEALTMAEKYGQAIVFFDEINSTTPAVQAAMLTALQSRRIGRYVIPNNVYLIAAGNPADQAADGWLLAPPMANRLVHIDFVPDIEDWFAGMLLGWNKDFMPEEERKSRSSIVGFLRNNSKYISDYPDTPEEAAGAWPSMRTWDNLSEMLGQIKGSDARRITIKGNVGKDAGDAYSVWAKNTQIPEYETVINHPENVQWEALDAGVLHVTLSTVVDFLDEYNLAATLKVFDIARARNTKIQVPSALVMPLINQAKSVFRAAGKELDLMLMQDLLKVYGKEVEAALQPA